MGDLSSHHTLQVRSQAKHVSTALSVSMCLTLSRGTNFESCTCCVGLLPLFVASRLLDVGSSFPLQRKYVCLLLDTQAGDPSCHSRLVPPEASARTQLSVLLYCPPNDSRHPVCTPQVIATGLPTGVMGNGYSAKPALPALNFSKVCDSQHCHHHFGQVAVHSNFVVSASMLLTKAVMYRTCVDLDVLGHAHTD